MAKPKRPPFFFHVREDGERGTAVRWPEVGELWRLWSKHKDIREGRVRS